MRKITKQGRRIIREHLAGRKKTKKKGRRNGKERRKVEVMRKKQRSVSNAIGKGKEGKWSGRKRKRDWVTGELDKDVPRGGRRDGGSNEKGLEGN